MNILSIDTSSNICGVSILENEKLICNLDTLAINSHSETLMHIIQNALEKSNLTINDINLLVCDIGPGSFTGLRIGVATVKGFCDTLNIPSVGISSLECLAYSLKNEVSNNNLICSILDCKNENCYFALYQKNNNELENLIEPQADNLEDALSILKTYCEDNFNNYAITFVGDGSVNFKDKIESSIPYSNFCDSEFNHLNSYSLGLAGLEKYNSGIELDEVLPLYLKKPLAQRQLEEKGLK